MGIYRVMAFSNHFLYPFQPFCSQYAKAIRKSFPHSKVPTLLRQPPACLCRGRTCNGSLLAGLQGYAYQASPSKLQVHLSPALSHNHSGTPSGLPCLPRPFPSFLPIHHSFLPFEALLAPILPPTGSGEVSSQLVLNSLL